MYGWLVGGWPYLDGTGTTGWCSVGWGRAECVGEMTMHVATNATLLAYHVAFTMPGQPRRSIKGTAIDLGRA